MATDGRYERRDREVEREVHREVHREIPRRRADHDASDSDPRVVKDASGTCWQVTEVSGRSVPGARGETCLIFESDAAIRRVWHYPEHWRDLPAPDLIEVSWNR
jgi:hypothetical protein